MLGPLRTSASVTLMGSMRTGGSPAVGAWAGRVAGSRPSISPKRLRRIVVLLMSFRQLAVHTAVAACDKAAFHFPHHREIARMSVNPRTRGAFHDARLYLRRYCRHDRPLLAAADIDRCRSR